MQFCEITELDKICRGCLSDKSENMQPLFEYENHTIFTLCTNLQVPISAGKTLNRYDEIIIYVVSILGF